MFNKNNIRLIIAITFRIVYKGSNSNFKFIFLNSIETRSIIYNNDSLKFIDLITIIL